MEKANTSVGFILKTMKVGRHERRYVVYVPEGYTPGRAWPVIMFLHGMGERGDDGLLQTEVGIGRAIRRHADRFPCLVVMPQCPTTGAWDKAVDDLDTALREVCHDYHVDPDRVYLTGLSMGGYGTWIYGAQRTDVYAALAPICGGGDPRDAAALARLPIWAFHGKDDTTVVPEKSREMVEAVKKAGGEVKYIEYAGVGHNSWDPAYDDPGLIKWLLKQRRARK